MHATACACERCVVDGPVHVWLEVDGDARFERVRSRPTCSSRVFVWQAPKTPKAPPCWAFLSMGRPGIEPGTLGIRGSAPASEPREHGALNAVSARSGGCCASVVTRSVTHSVGAHDVVESRVAQSDVPAVAPSVTSTRSQSGTKQ